MWADAANKAKSTDAAAIAKVLRSGTFQSAVGPLTYDAKGDIKDPVYDIYVWKDGKSTPTARSRQTSRSTERARRMPGLFLCGFKVL